MSGNKRIACWMSEKKFQKLNWKELEKACKKRGFTIFKLDLTTNLQSQGTFSVLLHKLTDIIAGTAQGDAKCYEIMQGLVTYLRENPHVIVVDPIQEVHELLDRYRSYRKIQATNLYKYDCFTPNFAQINTANVDEIANQLKNCCVTYPFISKSSLGHGSKQSHEMCIIFNENGLKDCKAPCVAQSFIPHNALLYKIFVVGDKHHVVERPSLKNFQIGERETIYFDSGDISKAGSRNSLTVLEPHEQLESCRKSDPDMFERIASTLRMQFRMDLLGIDVVIENNTGKYAIIDVNAYPGYDGFPDFYDALVELIDEKMRSHVPKKNNINLI